MKTVGIIGGLSPESTMSYYKALNQGAAARLGVGHSARIVISSVNFGEFVKLKEKGNWDTQGQLLAVEAERLEKAGVDFIILATNTMHKQADQITANISIPFLHIADATRDAIKAQGLTKIGLLGTKYTMQLDFYKNRLIDGGLEVILPDEQGMADVNRIIYEELTRGMIKDESKARYVEIIEKMAQDGAQGVIFGCTEIGVLVPPKDVSMTVFDTTQIHVQKTLETMFEGS